jgi:hypothetical protein
MEFEAHHAGTLLKKGSTWGRTTSDKANLAYIGGAPHPITFSSSMI